MRIFTAVRHANDPLHYYGALWSSNFYPAIRELGHDIVESQTDLFPTSKFMHVADRFTPLELEMRARTTERILDEVRAATRLGPIDLFLSYFYNAHFDPAGFDELRRLGIPSVNFYCNSIYQFEYVAAIARKADFAWHAERDARDSYLAVGANPVWVQMGADPKVYHPIGGAAREERAVFIGQKYADRDRWMAHLIRARVPVDVFGPGWGLNTTKTNVGGTSTSYLGRRAYRAGSALAYLSSAFEKLLRYGPLAGNVRIGRQMQYRSNSRDLAPLFISHARGGIPFTQMSSVLSRYRVCLNFSNVWADGQPGSRLIPHVRLRDFEAPMCQSCYLTGHTDEIGEFYEIGREIDTYHTPEELVDKARFYLANDQVATRISEAGLHRARRDHTWQRRFQELFLKVGILGKQH